MKSKIATAIAGALLLATGAAHAADAAKAQEMLKSEGCVKCHEMDKKKTGPSLKDIAAEAKKNNDSTDKLLAKFKENPKHKKVTTSDADLKAIIDWIKTL